MEIRVLALRHFLKSILCFLYLSLYLLYCHNICKAKLGCQVENDDVIGGRKRVTSLVGRE